MEKGSYNMHWKGYNEHFKKMMKGMLVSKENSDVTLVCDELKTVPAHKNILSACSPVFKKMFGFIQGKELFLYMRGIKYHILESIMEFIYLGEVNLQEIFVEEFVNIANSLEISGLTAPVDDLVMNETIEEVTIEDRVETVFCKTEPGESPDLKKEAEQKNVPKPFKANLKVKDSFEEFKCSECGEEFKSYQSRQRHKRSVHDGIRYPCDFCDHQATFRQNLLRHVKTMHSTKDE